MRAGPALASFRRDWQGHVDEDARWTRPLQLASPVLSLTVEWGATGPYTDRGIRALLTTLGRRADVIHVHPHRFRHDAARRLVEAAVDLPTVAALLGHSRLETVRLYTQPDEAALERATAALESG